MDAFGPPNPPPGGGTGVPCPGMDSPCPGMDFPCPGVVVPCQRDCAKGALPRVSCQGDPAMWMGGVGLLVWIVNVD